MTGLNVVGWASAPTGVGEACRGTLLAAQQAALPPRSGTWTSAGDDRAARRRPGIALRDLLFHVNADMMEPISRQLPRALVAGRHRIGYWFWELSHFPLSSPAPSGAVDEVWAPDPLLPRGVPRDRAGRGALDAALRLPRHRRRRPTGGAGHRAGEFLFFFAFDALSVPERKNPDGLLRGLRPGGARAARPFTCCSRSTTWRPSRASVASSRRSRGGLPVTLVTRT